MQVLYIALLVSFIVSLAYAATPQVNVCVDLPFNAGHNFNEVVCPAGMYFIGIDFASLGTPTGSCASGFAVNPSCHMDTSGSRLAEFCLGRNKCKELPVSTFMFPSMGCATHFRAKLRCGTPTSYHDMCIVAQQGGDAAVDCPHEDMFIGEFKFASYGATCFNEYILGSCHSPTSTTDVQSRCLGINRCEFDVDSQFVDPCVGIQKNYIVKATCSDNSKTCTQATDFTRFDLQCPPGTTISNIDFASYGTANGNCSAGITTAPFCNDPVLTHTDFTAANYMLVSNTPDFELQNPETLCASASKTLIIGAVCMSM